MPEVTIQLSEDWPTSRMIRELFANFAVPPRVSITTGYGERVTVVNVPSGDIGLNIVDTDGNHTQATFTTAGGGHVMRRTNLALMILAHAIASDQNENNLTDQGPSG